MEFRKASWQVAWGWGLVGDIRMRLQAQRGGENKSKGVPLPQRKWALGRFDHGDPSTRIQVENGAQGGKLVVGIREGLSHRAED